MNTEQKRSLLGVAYMLLRILSALGSKHLRKWLQEKEKNEQNDKKVTKNLHK